MPARHGGDDFVGVDSPVEGLGLLIVHVEEAVDGGLQVGDGSEYAALQPPFGQDGEWRSATKWKGQWGWLHR